VRLNLKVLELREKTFRANFASHDNNLITYHLTLRRLTKGLSRVRHLKCQFSASHTLRIESYMSPQESMSLNFIKK